MSAADSCQQAIGVGRAVAVTGAQAASNADVEGAETADRPWKCKAAASKRHGPGPGGRMRLERSSKTDLFGFL